jgi:hypothetical protein
MVSAIGIIPIPLYLLRRNEDVFPVFSAFGVDAAVNEFDFGRVTVRIVTTAGRGIVGHMPARIELFVEPLILWRMVGSSLTSPNFLRAGRRRRQKTTKTTQ